jgi:hypothetical protein
MGTSVAIMIGDIDLPQFYRAPFCEESQIVDCLTDSCVLSALKGVIEENPQFLGFCVSQVLCEFESNQVERSIRCIEKLRCLQVALNQYYEKKK